MQNQQIDSKLQQKIKALLAMAEGGTENEAAIAAQKLQEISIRHGIDIASVCGDEAINTSTLDPSKGRASWKGGLAMTIAHANFCQVWTTGSQIAIAGKPQYVQIVNSLYSYILSAIDRLCDEGAAKQRNYYRRDENVCLPQPSWVKWRNDFKRGCAVRIIQRIKEQVQAAKTVGIADGDISAIVVQNAYKREAAEIAKHLSNTGVHLSAGRKSSVRVTDGYDAGKSAGNRVGLNGQVGAGAGQRQLAGR